MIEIPKPLGLYLAQHLVETMVYSEALDIYSQFKKEELTGYNQLCYAETLLEEWMVHEAYEYLKSIEPSAGIYEVLLGKCQTLLNIPGADKVLDHALLTYQGMYLFDTLFGANLLNNKDLKCYMELASTIYPDSNYEVATKAVDYLKAGSSMEGEGMYVEAVNYFAGKNVVMTSNPYQTFEYLAPLATVDGPVFEFGVRNGYSLRKLAELFNDNDKVVMGFDSFEGLPEDWGVEKKGRYKTKRPFVKGAFICEGKFEEKLPAMLNKMGQLRFVNMDCDIYSSTKYVLDQLTPHVGKGTIIVFDEFILNPTWKEDECKAFEEWVAENNISYEFLTVSLYSKQVSVRIL